MKNIAIINACIDLGINIDGASLGSEILTRDLEYKNIVSRYTIKNRNEKIKTNIKKRENDKTTIQDFFEQFNLLLLRMHKLHFGKEMSDEEEKKYNQKMHNLVLAVKALDENNEKRNLKGINEFNKQLYKKVQKIIANDNFPLTVGGDHIVAIGSSLASIKQNKNLGMIWFDSHADFNTYLTSVTGNLHGLPLAVATNYETTLLSDFHDGPFYNPKNTVIVGGRDIDPWEWPNILDAGVTVFSTKDIQKYGIEKICEKAFLIASTGTKGVHISFDLDLIDPKIAPGVSVLARDGIDLKQTYELVDEIVKYNDIIKSADLVEYNPLFDRDEKTKKIAQHILRKWIENF